MNYFAAKLIEILKHTLVIVSIFFIVRLLFAVCFVPFTTFEAYAKSFLLQLSTHCVSTSK